MAALTLPGGRQVPDNHQAQRGIWVALFLIHMPTFARTPETEERVMRSRRRACFYGAGVMCLFIIHDLINDGPAARQLLLIRLLWTAALAGVGLALPGASANRRGHLFTAIMLACALAMSAIALVSGDHHTAYFAWLMAMPFCLVVFAREEVRAAIIGCLTSFAGAAFILLTSEADLGERMQWLFCAAAACGTAIYASMQQRNHFVEEQRQNRARLDALDQLGESEKRRAQAERMALVGQLAAGVAHEINNPLGFVMANLQFLEGELVTPTVDADERIQVMGETQLGLKRIKDIVGDLTAFSREADEQTTQVDLHEVVTEAERLASSRTKGRIRVLNELPADLRMVVGNRRHLAQVFLNLFLNSADALGTGRADGKIWIRATAEAGKLSVEVDDNGPGFPPAVLPSLFQPFFTTKAPGKGTGLGLATSREYLRRAGGELSAMPRPGGGARFTLALRCAV